MCGVKIWDNLDGRGTYERHFSRGQWHSATSRVSPRKSIARCSRLCWRPDSPLFSLLAARRSSPLLSLLSKTLISSRQRFSSSRRSSIPLVNSSLLSNWNLSLSLSLSLYLSLYSLFDFCFIDTLFSGFIFVLC